MSSCASGLLIVVLPVERPWPSSYVHSLCRCQETLFLTPRLFLTVKVPVQLARFHFHLGAVWGDFDLRRPQNCIDDQAPEVFIPPVFVEMCAGESKRAAAARAVERPGQDFFPAQVLLRFFCEARFVRRHGLENRRNALHVGSEANAVIP